jgi:hypothetical protein
LLEKLLAKANAGYLFINISHYLFQKSTNTAFYLENTTDNVAKFCFYCVCKCQKKVGISKETFDSRFGQIIPGDHLFLQLKLAMTLKLDWQHH